MSTCIAAKTDCVLFRVLQYNSFEAQGVCSPHQKQIRQCRQHHTNEWVLQGFASGWSWSVWHTHKNCSADDDYDGDGGNSDEGDAGNDECCCCSIYNNYYYWWWLNWGGDSSVVRTPDLWLKGHRFKSLQEQRENFLLQGQLSVLTLFQYPFHPCVTAVAHKRSQSFCQKCRWQIAAKHAYTLRMWLCMKWHGAWLYAVHRTCAEMAAVSCVISHASAVSTPLLWIFKKRCIKS